MMQDQNVNAILRKDAVDIRLSAGDAVQAPLQRTDYVFDFGRDDVSQFQRVGDDLIITLSDGSTVRIFDYYANSFENTLVFTGENGAGFVAFPFVIAGGALLGLTGMAMAAGGSDGSGRIAPTVNDASGRKDITTNSLDKYLSVSGTGQPGETVLVTIGTKNQTTTIQGNGTWATKFEGDNFPSDGSFEAVVKVTTATGVTQTLDGPSFLIDLTSPAVSSTAGTVSVGDVENLAEYADGVTIKGEGEAGAKISVVVEGHTQSTTVGTDGKWTVTFTKAQIPAGENTFPATITATDGMGNKTVITDSIKVDTVPHPLTFNTTAEDNVINKVESAGEVTVTGQSTAGAMVTVTLGSNTQTVETGANGTWTVKYPAGTFTADGTSMTLNASTVDAAGNPSSSTQTIKIDTTTSVSFTTQPLFGGDNIINGTEANGEVTMSGISEVGTKSVSVVWNNTTVPAVMSADGSSWTVKFPSSAVPATGSSIATVNSIDAAGNPGTNTRTIAVDRETTVSVNAGQAGGDNTIMSTEANAGVTLTGKAEAGAKVEVTFQGKTHTVTASDTGTWSTKFESSEIKRGTYSNTSDNTVNVKATDIAGNIATTTHTLNVDTEVTNFVRTSLSTGTDNVLNNAEALNGLTVNGTVEVGAQSVSVTFGTYGTYPATVNAAAGTWTVTIPAGVIPQGENNVQLTAVAKDGLGNISALHTETVAIDRIVTPFTRSGGTIGGDDSTLSATEAANGLVLTGSGELGADVKVMVTSNGGTPFSFTSDSVSVGPNGTWTIRLDANQLPDVDNQKFNFTLQAKDEAGNIRDIVLDSVTVDTVAPDAPNIMSFIKDASGLSGVVLDETIDSNFSFHRVSASGSDTTLDLKTGSLGSDFARFDGATVPDGYFLVVNHEDTAKNESATLFLTDNIGATSTIDLNNAAFKDFDFTQLDLSFAKTTMSISAEQLIAITGPDNTLIIKGGSDDSVTMQDATKAGDQTGSPAGYTLYTLGDNAASIYLDDDIQRPNF